MELRLGASPGLVRTVRHVAAALGRIGGVADARLDDVVLAVGEACGLAVAVHVRHGCVEPIVVRFADDAGLEVLVRTAVALPVATGERAEQTLGTASSGAESGAGPEGPSPLAILHALTPDLHIRTGKAGASLALRWPR